VTFFRIAVNTLAYKYSNLQEDYDFNIIEQVNQ